jgi:hypothetical protein
MSYTRKCNFLFSHMGYVPLTVVLCALSVSELMLVAYAFKTEQGNKVLKCVTCEEGEYLFKAWSRLTIQKFQFQLPDTLR